MVAERVIAALRERGWHVATGESLTAGLVAAVIADTPGASDVLVGGIVAYDVAVKQDLLGVTDAELAHGVVSEEVARAMARGAAARLGAEVGVGTTGVAGPGPHGGVRAGTVWIAAQVDGVTATRSLHLEGDRSEVRRQTVVAALSLVEEMLGVPGGATPTTE